MVIELKKNELLFDMRNKSHSESSVITDMESRYRSEAGTEKTEELERDLVTSLSQLSSSIGRYLKMDMTSDADNGPGLPDFITLEFVMSERRLDGKVQALTDAIHAYLVENTLALFYASVDHKEFQAKHEKASAASLALVERLMFTKKPPYMTRH